MEITITLNEQDQLLQAEILKVLLKAPQSEAPTKTAKRAKKGSTKAPTEETEEVPAEVPTEEPAEGPTEKPAEGPTEKPSDAPETPTEPSTQPAPEKPSEEPSAPSSSVSMEDLRKSVNAISRTKGLNWLYSWLGDLGVKSIAEIPAERLEEANTKLQNYK